MTEKNDTPTVFFATVDRPGEAAWRRPICVKQTRARTSESGVPIDAESIQIDPDSLGIYTIDRARFNSDADYKLAIAVFKGRMDAWNRPKQPKRLIGPYTDRADALKQMHVERPKALEEQVPVLQGQVSSLTAETVELKARIAELEKKQGAR